jgi:hypothetical protein
MTDTEFHHLLSSIKALSLKQMRALRQELDSELASTEAKQQAEALAAPAAQRRKRIWEVAEEIRRSIPAEEWDKLPVDGAEQHDHYIYGVPKRPPTP